MSFRRAIADAEGATLESEAWRELQDRTVALKVHESPQSPRELALRGSDLAELLNLPPSRVIGELLNALLHHVWEHPEDNRVERLLSVAPRLAEELGVVVTRRGRRS